MDDHELRRLIDDAGDDPGGSALGRSLIASAQADVPSPDGRARAARRLGIAAVLAVGAGAGSEAGALAAVWKLAAGVVALGGIVGLAIWQAPARTPVPAAPSHALVGAAPLARGSEGDATALASVSPASVLPPSVLPPSPPEPSASGTARAAAPAVGRQPASPRPPSRPPPGSRVGAPPPVASHPMPDAEVAAASGQEPSPAAVPEVRAPEPAAPEPTALEPAAPEPATPEPVAPPAPEVTPPAPAEVTSGPGRLAAEVALVDRARTRLLAGDYPAAKAALAEYHQRFATGDLDAEAEVVTIELLIAEREVARARTLGTAFLARFPRSPLAQRVHSLLERLPK